MSIPKDYAHDFRGFPRAQDDDVLSSGTQNQSTHDKKKEANQSIIQNTQTQEGLGDLDTPDFSVSRLVQETSRPITAMIEEQKAL